MALGEQVGDAYIEVHADTDPFRKEIRRDASKAGREAGSDFGSEFGDGMDSELDSQFSAIGKRLRKEMTKEGHNSGEGFGEAMGKQVKKTLARFSSQFGEALIGGDWSQVVGQFDTLDQALSGIDTRLRNLHEQGELTNQEFSDGQASIKAWGDALRKATQKDVFEHQVTERKKFWDDEIKLLSDSGKRWSTWSKGNAREIQKMAKGLRNAVGDDAIDNEALERALEEFAESANTHFTKVGRDFDGKVLGKLRGSRNDFLNFIGVIGGGFETLVNNGVASVFDTIGGAVGRLGDKLSGMGGEGGILQQVGDNLTKAGDSITGIGKGGLDGTIIQIGALAIAFQLLVVAAGPVAAAISGAAGAITALASSVAIAAGGALLALGPILLAIGAGVAVALVGFSDLSDAMKNNLKPVTDWADEIKGVIQSELFKNIDEQVGLLTNTLDTFLTPLLKGSAGAVSDFADSFLAFMNAPGVQQSLQTLGTELPKILEELLGITGDLSIGLLGMFSAIAPDVTDILDKIGQLTTEFANWANTDEGRKQIQEFFDAAKESGKILWDIIVSMTKSLGELFAGGKDTGDSLLKTIGDLVDKFLEWIGSEEGQKQLLEWFQEAQAFGENLIGVIGDIGKLFDKLNSPTAQKFLTVIIGLIKGIIEVITTLAGWTDTAVTSLINFAVTLSGIWDGFTENLGEIWAAVLSWWNDTFVPWLDGLTDWAGGVVADFWAWLSGGAVTAWQAVLSWWNETVVPFFTQLGVTAVTWFADMWQGLIDAPGTAWATVMTWWNEIVVPWFTGLAVTVGEWITNWWSALTSAPGVAWEAVVSWWNDTVVAWFTQTAVDFGEAIVKWWDELTSAPGDAWEKVVQWWDGVVVPWFSKTKTDFYTAIHNWWEELKAAPGKAWASVVNWWNTVVKPWLSQRAVDFATAITDWWEGLTSAPGKAWQKVKDWWNQTAWPWLTGIFSADKFTELGGNIIQGILDGITGAWSNITGWLSDAFSNLSFSIPTPSFSLPNINWPWTATGGVFNGAQGRIIGEAGPEAVVPLNRDLNKVDPSVRALSAFAQGKMGNVNPQASGGVTIAEGAISVVSNYSDSRLVSEDVLAGFVSHFK